jgi:hypothetical protein
VIKSVRREVKAICLKLLWLCAAPLLAQTLVLLPPSVDLFGPEAKQQMVAKAVLSDHQEDWTRHVEWSSSEPKIASIDKDGMVRPVSDGEATITARAKGMSASVKVRVKNSHVQP